MKNKQNVIICTTICTVIGAGLGIMAANKLSKKSYALKRTAGKALRTAGSFIEHMSF